MGSTEVCIVWLWEMSQWCRFQKQSNIFVVISIVYAQPVMDSICKVCNPCFAFYICIFHGSKLQMHLWTLLSLRRATLPKVAVLFLRIYFISFVIISFSFNGTAVSYSKYFKFFTVFFLQLDLKLCQDVNTRGKKQIKSVIYFWYEWGINLFLLEGKWDVTAENRSNDVLDLTNISISHENN